MQPHFIVHVVDLNVEGKMLFVEEFDLFFELRGDGGRVVHVVQVPYFYILRGLRFVVSKDSAV